MRLTVATDVGEIKKDFDTVPLTVRVGAPEVVAVTDPAVVRLTVAADVGEIRKDFVTVPETVFEGERDALDELE